ncbi:hypothetical protein SprV_0602226500 [Sparganum proliferum]
MLSTTSSTITIEADKTGPRKRAVFDFASVVTTSVGISSTAIHNGAAAILDAVADTAVSAEQSRSAPSDLEKKPQTGTQ